MTGALCAEGENIAKLEKADVLELTVNHLQKLRRESRLSANPVTASDRFRAGFTQCAREVSVCLAATPGVDVSLGTRLMTHLGYALNNLEQPADHSPALKITTVNSSGSGMYSPPISPLSDSAMSPSARRGSSSWRPESPLSSGYGSDSSRHQHADEEIDVGSDVEMGRRSSSSTGSSVWRPW